MNITETGSLAVEECLLLNYFPSMNAEINVLCTRRNISSIFEVLMTVKMRITAFWDAVPYNIIDIYQLFGGTVSKITLCISPER